MKKNLILAAFIILVVDQLTKFFIIKNFFSGEALKLSSFLQIKYFTNTGAAFSILQDQATLLAWFSIVVIGFILFYYDKISKKTHIPVGLVLGGILGNLIDRISYGYVIDFIDFSFWPAFNIADSALFVGVIWLVVYISKSK
ncbi:signal peptidase II [Candidatus Woesearchaeota archaeon]|nr:signal peptidase II [Candidatus Woesearchaeota archaeon]